MHSLLPIMKKEKKKNRVWEIIKKITGIILIIIGIIGLFLPLLQGILLILIGLALFHNQNIKEYILKKVKKVKPKAF